MRGTRSRHEPTGETAALAWENVRSARRRGAAGLGRPRDGRISPDSRISSTRSGWMPAPARRPAGAGSEPVSSSAMTRVRTGGAAAVATAGPRLGPARHRAVPGRVGRLARIRGCRAARGSAGPASRRRASRSSCGCAWRASSPSTTPRPGVGARARGRRCRERPRPGGRGGAAPGVPRRPGARRSP